MLFSPYRAVALAVKMRQLLFLFLRSIKRILICLFLQRVQRAITVIGTAGDSSSSRRVGSEEMAEIDTSPTLGDILVGVELRNKYAVGKITVN